MDDGGCECEVVTRRSPFVPRLDVPLQVEVPIEGPSTVSAREALPAVYTQALVSEKIFVHKQYTGRLESPTYPVGADLVTLPVTARPDG